LGLFDNLLPAETEEQFKVQFDKTRAKTAKNQSSGDLTSQCVACFFPALL
jgi:hypothetical protein